MHLIIDSGGDPLGIVSMISRRARVALNLDASVIDVFSNGCLHRFSRGSFTSQTNL